MSVTRREGRHPNALPRRSRSRPDGRPGPEDAREQRWGGSDVFCAPAVIRAGPLLGAKNGVATVGRVPSSPRSTGTVGRAGSEVAASMPRDVPSDSAQAGYGSPRSAVSVASLPAAGPDAGLATHQLGPRAGSPKPRKVLDSSTGSAACETPLLPGSRLRSDSWRCAIGLEWKKKQSRHSSDSPLYLFFLPVGILASCSFGFAEVGHPSPTLSLFGVMKGR